MQGIQKISLQNYERYGRESYWQLPEFLCKEANLGSNGGYAVLLEKINQ